jgi:hypothetical protein
VAGTVHCCEAGPADVPAGSGAVRWAGMKASGVVVVVPLVPVLPVIVIPDLLVIAASHRSSRRTGRT